MTEPKVLTGGVAPTTPTMEVEPINLDDFDQLHTIACQSDARRLVAHLPRSPLLDDYSVVGGELGRGANGVVRKCKHKRTGTMVAVKTVMLKPGASHSQITRLHNEIYYHMLCRHENIASLFFVYINETDSGHTYYFFVMELLSGGELFFRIKQEKKFTEEDARKTLQSLAEALNYLHLKGIAHRDLKPENLVLVSEGCHPWEVKLIDFGYARTGAMSTPLGSGFYVSPEVIKAYRARYKRSADPSAPPFTYDTQTDMWTLGIVFYIILTGIPPFSRKRGTLWYKDRNLQKDVLEASYKYPRGSNISDKAKDLVAHLLTIDPHKRFTAIEVLCHPWVIGGDIGLSDRVLDSPRQLAGLSDEDHRAVNEGISGVRDQDVVPKKKVPAADMMKASPMQMRANRAKMMKAKTQQSAVAHTETTQDAAQPAAPEEVQGENKQVPDMIETSDDADAGEN